MELAIIGLALSALLAVAVRDVGRPGRASSAGLRACAWWAVPASGRWP